MTYLILGLILFFGPHSVAIFASPWRDRMLAKLGEGPWKGIYSIVSIAGFLLIIYGYGLARRDPTLLYTSPHWMRYVTDVLMVPVFPLLFAPYFPGRIKATVKHPMLTATKLWAVAHLLVNGMFADVLLFGSFLVWAVADRISVNHRPPRALRAAPERKANDLIVIVIGLALYFAFAKWLHIRWIGVSPLP